MVFPVECCAEAIVHLSYPGSGDGTQATTALKPVKVEINDLMERVGSCPTLRGRQIHAVSRAVWHAELQQLSGDNPMFPLISHYQDGLPGERPQQSENTCEIGYSQVEVDRCVAFLDARGMLGTTPKLPMLVRTSSLKMQLSRVVLVETSSKGTQGQLHHTILL